jgi:hypothetical protein
MQRSLNYFCYFPYILFIILCSNAHAQQRKIIHQPQTTVIVPGLRRAFKTDLKNISLEANPGWKAEEIFDSSDNIYQLVFSDPEDSSKRFLSLLLENYRAHTFDSAGWYKLKQSIRESYGDRGIALRPLGDTIFAAVNNDSTVILARYELLAKQNKYLEYICAMVGKTSLILLTVPLEPDEYAQKIIYFKEIAYSVRLR